jgi:hypothetical protein
LEYFKFINFGGGKESFMVLKIRKTEPRLRLEAGSLLNRKSFSYSGVNTWTNPSEFGNKGEIFVGYE